jgi:hypothetical protein
MNKKGIEVMEASYSLASTFVDKVSCICKGPNAKLVFFEDVPDLDTSNPRVSVTMDIASFFSMVETLLGVANQIKEQQELQKTAIENKPEEAEKEDEVLH